MSFFHAAFNNQRMSTRIVCLFKFTNINLTNKLFVNWLEDSFYNLIAGCRETTLEKGAEFFVFNYAITVLIEETEERVDVFFSYIKLEIEHGLGKLVEFKWARGVFIKRFKEFVHF